MLLRGARDRQGDRELPSPGSGCRSRWCGCSPGSRPRRPGSTPSSACSIPARRSGSPPPPKAVAAGDHDDQFPIDVFQTGSGTNSNTNVNEVVATLAGDSHHSDHVNMGQSSNDTFPTAVHLAALRRHQRPAAGPRHPGGVAGGQGGRAARRGQAGRTHLMDAVPVTLGQEFAGYAAQVQEGGRVGDALVQVRKVPLGGTAVGTGLNAHPEFMAGARAGSRRHRPGAVAAGPPVRGPGRRDAWSSCPGALKTVAVSTRKIANDIRWMGSGRGRAVQLILPELLGLLDHARQGQPGHGRGPHPGVGPGHRQRRRHHGGRPRALRAERLSR